MRLTKQIREWFVNMPCGVNSDIWIARQVKIVCFRRIVIWSIAAVLVALLVASQYRYFFNFACGPFEVIQEQLNSITNINDSARYFATVNGSKIADTGIQQTTTRNGVVESTDNFYVLEIGDRLLLVESTGPPTTTVTGEMAPIPPNLDKQILKTSEMQPIRERFYPFYICHNDFRMLGYIEIGALFVFALFFVGNVFPAWVRFRYPRQHPAITRAAAWRDLDSTSCDVEVESLAANRR
jgi:hypothetical protein